MKNRWFITGVLLWGIVGVTGQVPAAYGQTTYAYEFIDRVDVVESTTPYLSRWTSMNDAGNVAYISFGTPAVPKPRGRGVVRNPKAIEYAFTLPDEWEMGDLIQINNDDLVFILTMYHEVHPDNQLPLATYALRVFPDLSADFLVGGSLIPNDPDADVSLIRPWISGNNPGRAFMQVDLYGTIIGDADDLSGFATRRQWMAL